MKANHLSAEMPVSKVFLQLAFPAAASRGCCGGVRTLGDREDVGSVRTLRDREDVGSVGTLGDREASEVFIPLGGGCPGIAGWS